MTKLFILGVTGYIGGTAAVILAKRHPEYEITALVRTEEQAKKVKDVLPDIKTVLGDLDNIDVIKEESAKSDIVLNCANSDHSKSLQAVLDGLGGQDKKTYFVHTTGVFHFFGQDLQLDSPTEKVWSDVDDLEDLHNLPVVQLHGPEDKLVMSRGGYDNVNVAMVDPPCVYGKGLGPLKTRGTLIPMIVKAALLNKKTVKLGEGKPTWSAVHVEYLAEVFIWLLEQATEIHGGKADWNKKGWYFAENDTFNWGDLAQSLAKIGEAKGYFESHEVEGLPVQNVKAIFEEAGDPGSAAYVPYCLGAAVRIRSDRLRSLGFDAEKPTAVSTLEEVLEIEAESLGIKRK